MDTVGELLLNKMVLKARRAATSPVGGASVDRGDGFSIALIMSLTPARMRSAEDATGMVTLVGNHTSVSEIRSRLVFQIQTL